MPLVTSIELLLLLINSVKIFDFNREFNVLTFTVITDIFMFKSIFYNLFMIFSTFCIYIFPLLSTSFGLNSLYYLISVHLLENCNWLH